MSKGIKGDAHSKYYVIKEPTRLADLSYEELYDGGDDWRRKARDLQIRRWRKIKHQVA